MLEPFIPFAVIKAKSHIYAARCADAELDSLEPGPVGQSMRLVLWFQQTTGIIVPPIGGREPMPEHVEDAYDRLRDAYPNPEQRASASLPPELEADHRVVDDWLEAHPPDFRTRFPEGLFPDG